MQVLEFATQTITQVRFHETTCFFGMQQNALYILPFASERIFKSYSSVKI